MALRRQQLHHRIRGQATNHQQVMASGHPGPSFLPATPHVTPLSVVEVYPVSSGYVTLAASELMPIITADGAMVPATGPGQWDQLRLAGGGLYG